MTEVAAALLAVLVLTGIGWSVVGWLDKSRRLTDWEHMFAGTLLGFLAIYYLVAALGAWRLETPTMRASVALSILIALPGLIRMPWRRFLTDLRSTIGAGRADPVLGFFWVAAVAVAASSLLQGLAPPNDYDSLMYHLAVPKFDVESGVIGVPWDRGIWQIFSPALVGHMNRLLLIIANDRVAQMLAGYYGVIAAAGVYLLSRRLQFSARVSIAASLLFLSLRVVVWQMATVQTDIPVAAFFTMSLLVITLWWRDGGRGLAVLLGLLLGGAILAKLTAGALAISVVPLLAYGWLREKRPLFDLVLVPMAAFAAAAPHFVRIFALTGNPVYPLFHTLFHPGAPPLVGEGEKVFGTGQSILDLLLAPWLLSVMPMQHFDGMVLGAPLLLMFVPLILVSWPTAKLVGWLLGACLIYFVIWFYVMPQAVRFLVPILPLLCLVACAGLACLWLDLSQSAALRAVLAAIIVVAGLNQSMFVGIYSLIRLPVATGLMSEARYHKETPTLGGAHFETCTYISRNLQPDERFFTNTGLYNSYYCPQARAVRNYFADESKWWLHGGSRPTMSHQEFVDRVVAADFRYFMTSTNIANRRNNTARTEISPVPPSKSRFGEYLAPVFRELTPLVEGPFTAVYDGAEVIAKLRELSPSN